MLPMKNDECEEPTQFELATEEQLCRFFNSPDAEVIRSALSVISEEMMTTPPQHWLIDAERIMRSELPGQDELFYDPDFLLSLSDNWRARERIANYLDDENHDEFWDRYHVIELVGDEHIRTLWEKCADACSREKVISSGGTMTAERTSPIWGLMGLTRSSCAPFPYTKTGSPARVRSLRRRPARA